VTTPCDELLGKTVTGVKRGGSWKIIEKVERRPDGSGGTFSVGYFAVHDDGTEAFVKATDIGLLTRFSSADALTKMGQAIFEQNFERRILDICQGGNLDRVVHAIDYGQLEVNAAGVRDIIFYIMFEKAKDGDVRKQINRERRQTTSWCLCALHNLTVAIQQLHKELIAHNDIKPSNFLVFNEYLQKLADLGRAVTERTAGPWDETIYSGDQTYAAPEFWYPNSQLPDQQGRVPFYVRRASDLFHLGSMAFFLITGEKLTPLMRTFLRPEHNQINWRGTYEEILPFLRDAFGRSMEAFDAELPRDDAGALLPESIALRASVAQLCDPDPRRRGHPLNRQGNQDRYSVERYVSLFDSSAKTLRIRERK